jgi:hypothetical protein
MTRKNEERKMPVLGMSLMKQKSYIGYINSLSFRMIKWKVPWGSPVVCYNTALS